jgi:hypothetical protein
MNDADYQELLSRAASLMDERLASIRPAALPGNIPIRGRTASYTAVPVEKSSEYDFKMYIADLQLDGNRVRVVPYAIYNNPSDALDRYFLVPKIKSRSIFQENPPTLARRSGGAAVYLETVIDVYDTGEKYQDTGMAIFQGRLIEANIVDRSLGSKYPIKKATISGTAPLFDDWNVEDSEAKVYHLIGVYNSRGEVFRQANGIYEEPFGISTEGRRKLPPGGPNATLAPIKYKISIEDTN